MTDKRKLPSFCVAIDPGNRSCGVALFQNGELIFADFAEAKHAEVEADQFFHTSDAVWKSLRRGLSENNLDEKSLNACDLVFEYPQQYMVSPAPRESVQRLVGVIGAISSRFQAETGGLSIRVSSYKPSQWKGQVPKDIMGERIKQRLNDKEQSKIPSLSRTKVHNVLDSIGVGLFHLKRLRRKRVGRRAS